jgi:hypothetical protein
VCVETALLPKLQEFFESTLDVWRERGHPVLILGTMSDASSVSPALQALFKQEVSFEVCPDEITW